MLSEFRKKKCCRCNKRLFFKEFGNRKDRPDGKQTYCLECGKEYHKEHYKRNKPEYYKRRAIEKLKRRTENRSWLLNYLKLHPCVDCSETDIVVLEFDHVRGSKENNISTLVGQGMALSRITSEVEKCDVRCANCHKRKTAKQFGWFKLQA